MDRFAASNVMKAIFRRRMGNAQKTKLFSDLPESRQQLLLEHVKLEVGEEPVIAYLGGDVNWCLVTNRGLFWLDVEGIHRLSIFDVARFTHDMGVALRRGHLDKRQFHELSVHTKSAETWVIQLEAGAPFYAVWRTLDWMLDWANRPRQTASPEDRVA
ncbi:MAG: hypothetical protein JSU82_04310 [Rhodospirillales bacterium]|nr:MAG: hypothetical protein JSU82_04310 [Rhodospirillales bacterium]